MPRQARARLLETAEDLFYAEGIRAVGIDRVLAASGVGKASLYRHFASKEELVVAVLRSRDESWRAWLQAAVADADVAASERPLAIFDALASRFSRRDYRGCAFINAMVEAADRDGPIHRVAAEHKRELTHYVQTLLAEAGRDDLELAESLVLLIDGAIVTAVRTASAEPARRARTIAEVVLAARPCVTE